MFPCIFPRALGLGLLAVSLVSAAEPSLPEVLRLADGRPVSSVELWKTQRRPEILELFRSEVYGRMPIGRPPTLHFEVSETDPAAMGGAATRKQVIVSFTGPGGQRAIRLVLFIPNAGPKPAPCFLLICNRGAENIDATREKKSAFWPAETVVARGYAAAAFLNSDVDPDVDDGFHDGVHGVFDPPNERRADSWATIAAWAWGASRVLDYLQTDPGIDAAHVAVVGHSRGGKTALWAGAEDERFALVISNESGSTGAAVARGKSGETIADINARFPHWFCANYRKYNGNEAGLPVDQHMLAALIAPRLLYIASAEGDAWSDPAAEFLAARLAGPVYGLFGLQGVGAAQFPAVESPLQTGAIGYHVRSGKHNLTEYDWGCFLDFADRHWR